MQSDYKDLDYKQLREKVITPSLSKLRTTITDAVKRVDKNITAVDNPIPYDATGALWQAAIEIGYAVKNDDGKLVFKLSEEIGIDRPGR